GFDVDYPELGVGQQHAAAFGFDSIQGSLMRGGAGFRQAVPLNDAKAEAGFHASSHVGRERRRRAERGLDRSAVRSFQTRRRGALESVSSVGGTAKSHVTPCSSINRTTVSRSKRSSSICFDPERTLTPIIVTP